MNAFPTARFDNRVATQAGSLKLTQGESVEPFHKFRSTRASFERLALTVLDRSSVFENTYFLALLASAFNFLSDKDKWQQHPNWPTLQKTARVCATQFPIGRK